MFVSFVLALRQGIDACWLNFWGTGDLSERCKGPENRILRWDWNLSSSPRQNFYLSVRCSLNEEQCDIHASLHREDEEGMLAAGSLDALPGPIICGL